MKFIPDREITVTNAIKEYLAYSKSIGSLSSSSLYNRGIELRRLKNYLLEMNVSNVSDIQKHMLITYLGDIDVSAVTKKTIMNIICSFLDYLINENLILDNYLANVKKPKVYEIEGDYLSKEEIDHLFYTLVNNTNEKLIDRNLLLISLFTILCMRVTETLQLKMSDVHINESVIWVNRKGGKIAKLPLNENLIDQFQNWYEIRKSFKKGSNSIWVFISTHGKQMTVRQARNVVEKAIKKAGIVKRKNGPHLLRHSGATLYLKQGEDIKTIQYLLGHSNLTTTSKYVHSDSATLRNSINNCPVLVKKY